MKSAVMQSRCTMIINVILELAMIIPNHRDTFKLAMINPDLMGRYDMWLDHGPIRPNHANHRIWVPAESIIPNNGLGNFVMLDMVCKWHGNGGSSAQALKLKASQS
jgi:hypothetical protein